MKFFYGLLSVLLAGSPLSVVQSEESSPLEGGSEIDRVRSGFGYLRTIAGRGKEQDGNYWEDHFEGAFAVEVELSNPHMAMADQVGNIYIADKESNRILRLGTDSRIYAFAGGGSDSGMEGLAKSMVLNQPNGLYVLPSGIVYVLDTDNARICRVDLEGNLTTILTDPAGFGPGRALWVASDESHLYFPGDDSVKRWTSDGGIETVMTGLVEVGNVTVDPSGNLFVTDREGHRVYSLDSGGTVSIVAGNGTAEGGGDGALATETGLDNVRGIAFHPEGGYFLATHKGGDIWYVDTKGYIHLILEGTGDGNLEEGNGQSLEIQGEKISEPRAVTLTPGGDLLITTNDKGFIRMVTGIAPPEWDIHINDDRSELVLSWPSFAGKTYLLEFTESLSPGSWLEGVSVPGRVGEVSHTLPLPQVPQGFIRLRVAP